VVRSAADASHGNKRGSSQIYKNQLNYWSSSQVLSGKIVTISMNQERLIMMCQTEPGLRQITQTRILVVEFGLRCTT
jgi:hypothetical protein